MVTVNMNEEKTQEHYNKQLINRSIVQENSQRIDNARRTSLHTDSY